jgi:septal ring factor EnvC (AmiA/AmiB activator)
MSVVSSFGFMPRRAWMSDKSPSTGLLASLGSWIIPIVLTAFVSAIGFYFTTNNRIDSMQSQITSLQDMPTRVGHLEDERANDVANATAQLANLQAQVQGLQTGEHDLGNGISGITQQLATLQAQMAFLINQSWPNVPHASK